MSSKATTTLGETAARLDDEAPEGRISRKRRATRSRLLESAYEIMAKVGVDAAKIRDITDHADVGFGTFYNYFDSKDELAGEVLDCIVHDCGIRNAVSTRRLAASDPSAVMPISIRLVVREAASTPIWAWWARRPDLLVDRVRDGFAEFAKLDMAKGIDQGFIRLLTSEIDQAWAIACWMIVGGIHDIVVGDRPIESESFVGDAIARAWGYDHDTAKRISQIVLPAYGPASIDWTFKLAKLL